MRLASFEQTPHALRALFRKNFTTREVIYALKNSIKSVDAVPEFIQNALLSSFSSTLKVGQCWSVLFHCLMFVYTLCLLCDSTLTHCFLIVISCKIHVVPTFFEIAEDHVYLPWNDDVTLYPVLRISFSWTYSPGYRTVSLLEWSLVSKGSRTLYLFPGDGSLLLSNS